MRSLTARSLMEAPQDRVFEHFQIQVHTADLGGWLRFFVAPESTDHPELPFYLSFAVSQWFRTRPHLRPRFLVPITREGNTIEMHVWYDQQLFPDHSGIRSQPAAARA